MSLFQKADLDVIWTNKRFLQFANKSSDVILRELYESFDPGKTYDIFLSHCYQDKNTIVGLLISLKEIGYSIYVDWMDDPQLDRSKVTKKNADLLRERMGRCQSLFFVTSENYSTSKWMPWELGYFDGKKNKAAVLPISEKSSHNDQYFGTEYLGLYPYITKTIDSFNKTHLNVKVDGKYDLSFDMWLKSKV